jgi:hypothetical protein
LFFKNNITELLCALQLLKNAPRAALAQLRRAATPLGSPDAINSCAGASILGHVAANRQVAK